MDTVAQTASECTPVWRSQVDSVAFPPLGPRKGWTTNLAPFGPTLEVDYRDEAKPWPVGCYVPQRRDFCHGGDFVEENEWRANLAWAYARAFDPIAKRLEAREDGYGRDRARSLRMDPFERVETCGHRTRVVHCACRHVRVPVACGLPWLCSRCRQSFYRKWFRRLRRATRMHARAALATWRAAGRPRRGQARWVLLTLTTRHSGDLRADRRDIIQGWRKLRQWLWKRMGRFPFALVWEVTQGSDGRGHLHAHVAALWRWIDFSEVRGEWCRANPNSTRISIESAKKGAGGAASYLAKYTTKGVEVQELPPVLAANALAANYNQRLVTTSQRFYKPRLKVCQHCNSPWQLEFPPLPLWKIAPFAVWRADAASHGVHCRRGPPQAKLAMAGGCNSATAQTQTETSTTPQAAQVAQDS